MKRESLNLVLIIIVILIPLVSFLITTNFTRKTITKVTTEAVEVLDNSDNENVNAVGKLISIPVFITGAVGAVIVFFLWGIIVIISFISLILAIVARNIIKNKEKKVAYRVLMTLVFIPYTILEIIWLSLLATRFSPITLAYFICLGACLVGSYYLTYSKKMFITDENVQIGEIKETQNTEKETENKDEDK